VTDTLTVTPTGDRGIIIARTFDAAAAPLFKAWTTPDLLQRWLLGPPGWTMTVCEVDLRPGGAYRYGWRNAEGTEIGLGGVYREVGEPFRLVATERFNPPFDQSEAVLTLTFEDRDGRTTITNTAVYATPEARDGMLASGMERGIKASYDRLAELVG
jgi:uncharacterized protein YndB with AHSA1/START domain